MMDDEVELAKSIVGNVRNHVSNALECVSRPNPNWDGYMREMQLAGIYCSKIYEIDER